jgi:hypothetical protein
MTQVTQTVLNKLLSTIRSRREARSISRSDSGGTCAVQFVQPKIRQAKLSDYDAVIDLKRRWNLIPESFENWERFWRLNPALRNAPPELSIGWVLEAEGRVVGYLGSILSTYYFEGRRLIAVSSTGLVVEPTYRSVTMTLNAQFYRQKSDLQLGTTADPSVGKIAKAFKSDPLPQEDYDTVLFWVLQPHPFVEAVVKKLELHPALAKTVSIPGALAVGAEKVFRRRWPKKGLKALSIALIRVDEIGDEFQALWLRKLDEKNQLLADRSAEALRWHFTIPGDSGTTNVFCCRRDRELVGYAITRSATHRSNGMHRTLIADMLVKLDDAEVTRTLLSAVYEHSKKNGSDILEVMGFPHTIRAVCLEGNPYMRKYPATPFYYKAADPVLHKALSDGTRWYATPFDGDTTLMP